ncbi:MAG: formylglycine-generating enzyme family protein [Vicingaceae bacterium]
MKFNALIYLTLFSTIQACSPSQSTDSPELSINEVSSSCNGMIEIPAGSFWMGADNEQAEADEYPEHKVAVSAFFLDEHEVRNKDFENFVITTGYVTIAEKDISWEEMEKEVPAGTAKPHDSLLKAGSLVFFRTDHPVALDDLSQWWKWIIGANWKHPRGPGSSIKNKSEYPVVHVAWNDAMAYCQWKNKRLPTEAEWEWASRGGLENHVYSWGSEELNDADPKANYWQGVFPWKDAANDGYSGTAPVKSYPANSFGLYDMAGNVWEWCADWYDHNYYKKIGKKTSINPSGPDQSYDPMEPHSVKKVLRGGSFLCNEKYCSGYRNSRRMRNSVDTGMEHIGFRCACDK